MDQITLRNRLLVATNMWREATGDPLPKLPPGDPADQIQSFELKIVDRLWEGATPETRARWPIARGTSSTTARTQIRSSSAWSSATRRWRG